MVTQWFLHLAELSIHKTQRRARSCASSGEALRVEAINRRWS
jgi:hypothetical protein